MLTGCRGSDSPPPPPAPASSSPNVAADELRPGELAEGTLVAFGLKLPRLLRINATFPDAIFASGPVRPEDLIAYVRERVIAERESKLGDKTTFEGATSKASPASKIRVEIIKREAQTELIVRNETRPPAKEGLSEEERWKEHGLSPQGQILDPTKLE